MSERLPMTSEDRLTLADLRAVAMDAFCGLERKKEELAAFERQMRRKYEASAAERKVTP